jgi:hypothetical protein
MSNFDTFIDVVKNTQKRISKLRIYRGTMFLTLFPKSEIRRPGASGKRSSLNI